MEHDRPLWANWMINLATGICFGTLIVLVAIVAIGMIKAVADFVL